MKKITTAHYLAAVIALILIAGTGCQKGDLLSNPNAAKEGDIVPVSLILNRITYGLYAGAGVVDSRPNAVSESPWDNEFKWSQHFVSNYQYYRGANAYNWSNTATSYDLLKMTIKLEEQTKRQFTTDNNVYYALAKFFRAYSFIWLAQRVGDIPMSQAGDPNNLTPKYDAQKEVYRNSLALLDSANTILWNLINVNNAFTISGSAKLDANGDIFGLTNLQWERVINTYRLRVLISLSKRADDNPDLNIKQQFNTIISDPLHYPIMTGNSDNIVFRYNTAYNQYPIFLRGNGPYNKYANIGKTLLDLTTSTADPRTFLFATPAPSQMRAGKNVSDFSAYVGADINLDLSTLFNNGSDTATSIYSYANALRYYSDKGGANAEPDIVIGYPELCFNIAEGLNLGWSAAGTASSWYLKGVNASLSFYNLAQGQTISIGDMSGKKTLGTVTANINAFLTNIAYVGDNPAGRTQILQQKYVAFFNNSGWEAFYNWRRTGIPAFSQGGAGIGTPGNTIPRRWQYPQDEITYNSTNYTQAITSQFGGTDDLFKDTWLTK